MYLKYVLTADENNIINKEKRVAGREGGAAESLRRTFMAPYLPSFVVSKEMSLSTRESS